VVCYPNLKTDDALFQKPRRSASSINFSAAYDDVDIRGGRASAQGVTGLQQRGANAILGCRHAYA